MVPALRLRLFLPQHHRLHHDYTITSPLANNSIDVNNCRQLSYHRIQPSRHFIELKTTTIGHRPPRPTRRLSETSLSSNACRNSPTSSGPTADSPATSCPYSIGDAPQCTSIGSSVFGTDSISGLCYRRHSSVAMRHPSASRSAKSFRYHRHLTSTSTSSIVYTDDPAAAPQTMSS